MFQSIPQELVKDAAVEIYKQDAKEAEWEDDKHEEVHSTVDVKVCLKFKTTLDRYMKRTVIFRVKRNKVKKVL